MELRASVAALCSCIETIGAGRLSPEILRLAKHDRNETSPTLWILLYHLLLLQSQGEVRETEQCSLETKVETVKAALLADGCRLGGPAGIPAQSSCSARLLLFAVARLFRRCERSTRLLRLGGRANVHHKINTTTEQFICREREVWLKPPRIRFPDADKVGADGGTLWTIRRLQWLEKRLDVRRRSILAAKEETRRLEYKVHLHTQGVSLDSHEVHLALHDLWLLRDPQCLDQWLTDLEEQNRRLKAYVAWQEVEPVFWQWMGSILNLERSCKISNKRAEHHDEMVGISEHGGSAHGHIRRGHLIGENISDNSNVRSKSVMADISDVRQELCHLKTRFERLVDTRRTIFKGKMHELRRAEKVQSDVTMELHSLDSESERTVRQIRASRRYGKGPIHLRLDMSGGRATKLAGRGEAGGVMETHTHEKPITSVLKASETIAILSGQVRRLQRLLQHHQDKWRRQLEGKIAESRHIVCIPPHKRSSVPQIPTETSE
uniref:tubulin epsilon and delta complex protein 1 isoform X1 n=1 Tax=Myxine glutinosa TaxID=7769 RepID=UPI00358E7481